MLNRRRRWSTDTKSVLEGEALSGVLGFGTMEVGEVALEVLEVLSVVLSGGALEVLSVVLIGLIPNGSAVVLILVLYILSGSG